MEKIQENKGIGTCGSEQCSAHEYVTGAVGELKEIAKKLSEGQQQLQIGLARLTENMEQVRRLHVRMDNIEKDVGNLKSFMWKIMGGFTVFMMLVPVLLKLIGDYYSGIN